MKGLKGSKLESFVVVGLISIVLRQFAGLAGLVGSVTNFQVTVGCILAGIGLFMHRHELSKGYAPGKRQGPGGFGGTVFNGGTLVGISMLFLGVTLLKGIVIMALFGLVFFLLGRLVRNPEEQA
ncbi:MAG: hypothetical protein SPI65_05260 [Peptoniphilus sp.]|nr:hypothetical protein [Peptoniphilus sp.]MDD7362632.1 hypothetical protein [Bacillota bacterium]MDY6044969.1 hypothetical protein [Peptoniphilus sp.]